MKQQYEVRVTYQVTVVCLFPPSPKQEVFIKGLESEFGFLAHHNASGLERYFQSEIANRKEHLRDE